MSARRGAPRWLLLPTACLVVHTSGCGAAAGTRASAVTAGGSLPAQAVRSVSTAPDDRLQVRAHTSVRAVAATSRHVYALTDGGLVVYDRVFNRWDAPARRAALALEEAGVGGTLRAVVAADPVEDAVWLGTPGAVVIYRAAGQQVLRVPLIGQAEVIAFSAADPAHGYVRASGRWTRVSRAGFAEPAPGGAPALQPPVQLDALFREHPALRAQLPFLLRSALRAAAPGSGGARDALTEVRISAGTMSRDRPDELWIGTQAHGLWRHDVNGGTATWLPFGLAARSVDRLARGGAGVWAIGAPSPGGAARESGLSFLSNDLQVFRWPMPERPVPAPGARVLALAIRAGHAWVGTDRGLARAELGGDGSVALWEPLDGLASPVVYAVLPTGSGAWIGTARGLQFVAASEDVGASAGTNSTANAGAITRANAGAGSVEMSEPRAATSAAALSGAPVFALARFGEQLAVASGSGVAVGSVNAPVAAPVGSTSGAPGAGGVSAAPLRWLVSTEGQRIPGATVLALHDSLLLVGSDRRLAMYRLPGSATGPAASEGATLAVIPVPLNLAPTDAAWPGAIVAAQIDERAVWVAGRNGLLAWSRSGGPARRVDMGVELPGPITDLVLDAEWAWAGTTEGVVRIRRARDGGLP